MLAFFEQYKLAIGLGVLVFLLGMAADFLIMWPPYQAAKNKAAQSDSLLLEKQQLMQQLAGADMKNKIAEASGIELRKTVETLQTKLAEQEKELNFYQQLLAKRPGEKGLSLNTSSLIDLKNRRYLYRFAFVQYTKQHNMLDRKLAISLQGLLQGEPKTYALADLLADSVELPARLHFRYFQIVEGELILPEGFVPQSIHLSATARSRKIAVWQQQIPWQIKDKDDGNIW